MVDITGLSSFKYLVEERKLDADKLKELATTNQVIFKEDKIEIPMKNFD
jgi:hypothetical protein